MTTQAALEALYRKYNGPLYGYAYAILRSRAAAEDAVQVAFLRALTALDLSRDSAQIRSWLYVTVRNLCMDALRRDARNAGEEPLFDLAAPGDASGERALLNQCLDALDDTERQLWMLSLAGFRQREIAELAGIPMGTVSWRMAQIRRKLRAVLSPR